jgi:hypothetical protein
LVLRRHPLFTLAAAVSLLLLLAVVAGRLAGGWLGRPVGVTWIGHEMPEDPYGLSMLRMRFVSVNQRGVIHLGRFAGTAPPGFVRSVPRGWSTIAAYDTAGNEWGLKREPNGTTLMLPAWPLALVLAVLPLWWVRVFWWYRRRERRSRKRQCVACGYDLRESPERCPECGRVAA